MELRRQWGMLATKTYALSLFCVASLSLLSAATNPPSSVPVSGNSALDLFHSGTQAFLAGDFGLAATNFHLASAREPASGTFLNLGLAEWNRGRAGAAILAWERSLWLNPLNRLPIQNLKLARKTAQIESPDLTWYEVVSSWLPVNWWAWITGFSLWMAAGFALVPGILRWRKAVWQQAVAACALMFFLLSLPAHVGVYTRAELGFVQDNDAPLRLTPTAAGQVITRLASGDPARFEWRRGSYLLVRTSRGRGWIEQSRFALICPR